jgi:potassium/hydrogen antiporter
VFPVDRLILAAGVLIVLGIASTRLWSRAGMPVLVLFIFLGMLAGSEGIGGIAFENYEIAHGVATVALALILFDGGLQTPFGAFRRAWRPAVSLATVGVLITAAITGAAAAAILGVSPLYGILLGSIVGSTDAAAVFSILRSRGLHLEERVSATLEVESGSNDPMAIFLTIGILELIQRPEHPPAALLGFFALQMGVGLFAGYASGRLTVLLVNRVDLDAAGLYPVLVTGCGLLAYGVAASLGGSGFLAVYVAGVLVGNSRIVFQRGVFVFHDAGAWMAQTVMFILLGLLSFPSALIEVASEGLLIALVLTLVARPAAVGIALLPFRFRWRELVFLSWVGLKGAVPIILATYPLLVGIPEGILFFNVVFFVVLISALTQGWSLPWFAAKLGIQGPRRPERPVTLEITSLKHVDADIVEYTITPESRVLGRKISEIAFPDGAVVALIARDWSVIPPRGSTRLHEDDHVFLVVKPEARATMDRLFAGAPADGPSAAPLLELPLRGSATAGDLEEFYGIHLHAPHDCTLDEVIRAKVGRTVEEGDRIDMGGVSLRVSEMAEGRIERVSLVISDAGDYP